MNVRRLCALPVLSAVAALAACTSSGNGHTAGGASTSGSTPTTAAGLATLLQSAVGKITSAHVRLDASLSGQSLSGQGDEKLSHGKLQALDLTENLPAGVGSARIIIVNGKTYAKLPTSMNPTGKPYLLVSPNSSNPVVKQIAASLDSALSSASLGEVSAFLNSAKSVDVKGHETVNGVPTTHYTVVVDVAKLPSNITGKSALAASGVNTLPLDLYVDKQGRPVQLTEKLKVQGQDVSTKLTVTRYNQPVSITAPPASQIGG